MAMANKWNELRKWGVILSIYQQLLGSNIAPKTLWIHTLFTLDRF